MTLQEIVRKAIPEASEDLCDYLLWGRTLFPITRVTAKDIYRAANRHKRVRDKGLEMCLFCHRIVDPVVNDICTVCDEALHRKD